MLTRDELEKMNEASLRNQVLIRLFEAMGFRDVCHYHGGPELGKDIVMWREGPAGNRENYAVVVKAHRITGGVRSAGEVATQIRQCFGSSYKDSIDGSEQWIHRCYVVSSHEIAKEAVIGLRSALGDLNRSTELIRGAMLWELIEEHLLKESSREPVHVFPVVDTTHFTGRQQELDALTSLLVQRPDQIVAGLWGAPGVGKSALARHFAKQNTDQFPDGVISLHCRDSDARSLASVFAQLIGEPIDPVSESDASVLDASVIMQSRFARRRALLILDNANRPDIRQLVPGGLCTVLVTTRDRELLDHVGISSDAQIRIYNFEEDDSLAFLARLVDEEAVRHEEDLARELVRLVGGSPLALRIAGASLLSRSTITDPFAHYVADLRNEKTRLTRLQRRDADELNVLTVFSLDLPLLSPEERRTFASLAACAESGFSRAAATATAGLDEHTADSHLSRLANLALINFSPEPERFRLHALLYLFARQEAEEELDVWCEAQERHADFFTTYVRKRQAPSRQNLSDLEIEKDAVLQTARWKIDHGDLDVPFWLGLRHLLEYQGYWQTGVKLMQNYLKLAEQGHEDSTAAHFHLHLGRYALLLGRFDDAVDALQRSLSIGEELGDKRHIAMALNSLGGAQQAKGEFDEAIETLQRSLSIKKELGDKRGIAMALNSLGGVQGAKGEFDEAIKTLQCSLSIGEELGDKRHIAMALNSLGGVQKAKGEFDEAIETFQRSLSIGEELGDKRHIAMVLSRLGRAHQAKGEFDEAITAYQRCLDIDNELGLQRYINLTRKRLRGARRHRATLQKWDEGEHDDKLTAIEHRRVGKNLMRKGDFKTALNHFTAALSIGIESVEMGRLHAQAGEAALKLEDYEAAATYFRKGIALGEDTSFTNASLGRALHELQEPPESIRCHFERALSLDSKNAWAHSWFSTLLKDIGDLAQAKTHAERAAELQPENCMFLNNLGLILMDYGDRPHLLEAQVCFQKAMACAPPDFTWPEQYLQEVEQLIDQM